MGRIADLYANLSIRTSDFTRGLQQAVREARSAGQQMSSAMGNDATQGVRRYAQEVASATSSMSKNFKDVSRIVQGIAISQMFYGMVSDIKAATAAIIEYNSHLEQSMVAFKYLTGSQKQATYLMQLVQDLAADTSFSSESAVTATRQLMAYGFAAKETIPILRTMADASAVAGGDEDAFRRSIIAIGQIRAAGTIMKQDLNQLTNAGIPAIQILREELGLTSAEIKEIGKQKISSSTAIDALMRGLQKRYAGASDEMSRTTEGLKAKIQDLSLNLSQLFFKDSFAGFRNILDGIAKKLEHLVQVARTQGKAGVLGEIFGPEMVSSMKLFAVNVSMMIQAIGRLLSALAPVSREMINTFVVVVNALSPAIIVFVRALAGIVHAVTSCGPAIRFLGITMAGLFIASKVATAVSFLTRAIRALSVSSVVASFVTVLTKAINMLWMTITKNPIGAIITIAAGALLALAMSSKTATAWLDRLAASMGRLFGFDLEDIWEPPDPSEMLEGINEFNNSLGDVAAGAGDAGDALDGVGDKAENAGDKGAAAADKMAKKFIAAFDEVFQVPEEDDDKDKGKGDKPNKGDGGKGDGGAGDIPKLPDFDYDNIKVPQLPELKWPELPPFPPFPPIPPIPPPAWLPWAAYPPLPVFNPGLVPTPGWLPWPEFPPIRVPSYPPIPTPGWQPWPEFPPIPVPQFPPVRLPDWGSWPALPPIPTPQFPPVRLPDFGPWPQLPALPPVPMIPPIKMPSFPPWPDFPQLPKLPEFPPLNLPKPNFQAWGNSIKTSVEQALEGGRSICVEWGGKLGAALAPAGQAAYNAVVRVSDFITQGLATLPSTMASNAREMYTQAVNFGNSAVEGIKTGFNTVGEKVSTAWETVKVNTGTAWDNVRNKVSTAIEGMNTDSVSFDSGTVKIMLAGAASIGKAALEGFGRARGAAAGFATDVKGTADANALSMANIELTTGKAFSESEKSMRLVKGSLDEYKAAIVQAALQNGLSLDEVASKYNLTKDEVKKYSGMMVKDTLVDQASLQTGMSEKWESIKATTKDTWENIKTSLGTTWDNVKSSASTKFEGIKSSIKTAWDNTKSNTSTTWENIKTSLGTTWENVKSSASTKFTNIKDGIKTAWENTKSNTSSTWSNIKSTLSTTWDNVKKDAGTKFDSAKKTISQAWEDTKKNTNTTWESTKKSLSTTWETVKKDASTKFDSAKKTITQAWDETKKNTDTTWNAAKKFLGTTWDGVKGDANTKFNNVKSTIAGIWSGINTNTNTTWSGIKTFMGDSMNNILGAARNISGPFKSLWEGMANGVKTAFSGVVNAVKKPMNAIISAVNAAIRGINSIRINIPDWVPGIGGNSLGFNIAQIPHFATGGIVGKDTLARIGEGNKREAVIPLENGQAMNPFADAIAERLASTQQSKTTGTYQVGGQPIILQVGTLVADNRGITELKRRLDVIEIQESRRRR